MEINPPPYSPQYAPSAPSIDEVCQPDPYPVHPRHSQQFQVNPVSFGPSTSARVISNQPIAAAAPSMNPGLVTHTPQVGPTIPMRCMAGNVEIATGISSNLESIGTWTSKYIEVRDGMLFISPSAAKRAQPAVTRHLQTQFISMPEKKLVAIEDNSSSVVIKAPSEVRAHKWFMTLSQYCFVAPTMEGYCQKLSNRKKVFEERFIRLSSEGVLSWYRTHVEDSDRRGSIQVRGQQCAVDSGDLTKINIQVMPRTYQFKFPTAREAQMWLAALQWHYGRKSMRKAQVPLRNKAK